MMCVPIASLPGRLPLRIIDAYMIQNHICSQESGTGDGLGTKLQK